MMNRLAEPFGSFPDILMEWSRIKGDDLALIDEKREVYWAELVGLVERLAARLVETGLQRGQSVAILGTSTVEYALVFLAAMRAGGVAAPLTTSETAIPTAWRPQRSGVAAVVRHALGVKEARARSFACIGQLSWC